MTIHKARRRLGATDLEVTTLGVGGTGWGNLYEPMQDEDCDTVIRQAVASGLNYFDTAPLYGHGLSEERLGRTLRQLDRDAYIVSTKVGWRLDPLPEDAGDASLFPGAHRHRLVMDYSRQGILDSIENSMERLDIGQIDILLMHDPDEGSSQWEGWPDTEVSHFEAAMENAYPILDDLRAKGHVKAIGLGMNQWQMLARFAEVGQFDCFLLAGRYTLLEQTPLDEFLPMCAERQISVIIGGPFNSGILATGAVDDARFEYKAAPPHLMQRVKGIEAMCIRHGITLQAAALQFPLGHTAVASVIPGMRATSELDTNLEAMTMDVPSDFWTELKDRELIHPNAPTPS